MPPSITVVDPIWTVPLSAGGFWNDVPGGVGMCEGEFVAVEPTTAAGLPASLTVEISPPSSWPLNGCGSGVGTGPPGEGTSTMWVSTAMTGCVCVAAGCPIS